MASPVKHPRSSFPWFRRATPPDLLKAEARKRLEAMGIEVKREVKRSLRTRDPHAAKLRQAQLSAEWDARWQEWRKLLKDGPRDLSQKEVYALSAEIAALMIEKHSDNPGAPEDWSTTGLSHEKERNRFFGVEQQAIGALFDITRSHLRKRGLVVSDASILAITNNFAVKDWGRIYETLGGRADGNYSEPQWLKDRPKVDFKADGSSSPSITLTELHTVWRTWGRIREPREVTVGSYKRTLDEFALFVGHEDATRITPDDVQGYLEKLKAGKLSPKSIRDRMTVIVAVFNKAVKAHKLPTSPAQGMLPSAGPRGRAKRKAFTPDQARLILKATRKETGFRRWAPWLMAYSGMRVEEAGQLRKLDVQKVGASYFVHLTEEAGHIKNREDRLVPLHSVIIAEGFIKFATECKTERLFPEASFGRKGDRRDRGSKVLAPWVRALGIDDLKVPPNHGWRHWFRRFAEMNSMAPEARRLIEGRTEGLTEETYGVNGREEWLAKEMEKLPSIIDGRDGQ
jgi:integrase